MLVQHVPRTYRMSILFFTLNLSYFGSSLRNLTVRIDEVGGIKLTNRALTFVARYTREFEPKLTGTYQQTRLRCIRSSGKKLCARALRYRTKLPEKVNAWYSFSSNYSDLFLFTVLFFLLLLLLRFFLFLLLLFPCFVRTWVFVTADRQKSTRKFFIKWKTT